MDNPDIESLEQVVEDIHLPNLSVKDLQKMIELQTLKDDFVNLGYDNHKKVQEEIEVFVVELYRGYTEEELKKCALFYILTGEELCPDVEHLDTQGEYSIEIFLTNLL